MDNSCKANFLNFPYWNHIYPHLDLEDIYSVASTCHSLNKKEGNLPKILHVAIKYLAAKEDYNTDDATAEELLQKLIDRRKEFIKCLSDGYDPRCLLSRLVSVSPRCYSDNKLLMIKSLNTHASTYTICKFLSPRLRNDRELALEAIKRHAHLIVDDFANLRDKDFDLQALKINHRVYCHISPEQDYWDSKESKFNLSLIDECLRANFLNFVNLPEQLRADPNFVLEIAKQFLPSINSNKFLPYIDACELSFLGLNQQITLNEIILNMVEVNHQTLLYLPELPIKEKILRACFDTLKNTQVDWFAATSFEAFYNDPSLLEKKCFMSIWETVVRRQEKFSIVKLHSSLEDVFYLVNLLFDKKQNLNPRYRDLRNSAAGILFQYHQDKFIDDGWGAAERALIENPRLLIEEGDTTTVVRYSIDKLIIDDLLKNKPPSGRYYCETPLNNFLLSLNKP